MAYVELSHNGSKIAVVSEWAEKELVKQVPGTRWDPEARVWLAPLTWPTCLVLRAVFGTSLALGPNLRAWAANERLYRIDPAMKLREALDVPDSVDSPLHPLRPFQKATVNFAYVAGSILNANEMGCGKTVETLSTMRAHHLNDQTSLPACVIAPNSVTRVWEQETHKWFSEATPYVVTGGAAKRRKLLAAAAEDPTAVVIINIEAVRLHSKQAGYGSIRLKRCVECGGDADIDPKKCETHPRELNQFGFRTVIVDEAHRVKNPKAKQTRAVWAVAHGGTVLHRYALTGTPIANHVGDLWSVMHTIAPDEYPSRTKFLDRYALLNWNRFGGMDIAGVRPETRDEFFSVIHPRMRRVLKAVVLPQLPPKIRTVRDAPMTAKQARAYGEFSDKLITQLDDGSYVLATNNLTANTRLMQFSSAYATMDDDGKVTLSEPSSKLDVLEEILDELEGSQIAVCAESRQLIELAAARLEARGETYRLITGSVSADARSVALEDFQEHRARVMLFTVKAGGVGLTMTAASTIVFLQRSWSMLENRQAEDRVHRVGSEEHEVVQIIDIVAPGTVEETQILSLREKSERLEAITHDRIALAAAGKQNELTELDTEEANVLASDLAATARSAA